MNEKKIYVCHLVHSFDVGGLERIVANCINNLDDKKFHHIIISLTYVGEFISEIAVPIEHYELHKKEGNDISVYARLYRLLKQLKPDVLHTYNLGTIEYQWVALFAGIPLRVHAEHGRDSYDPNGTVKKYQWIRQLSSFAIHRIIAVSDELKQWLANEVKIPERKLELIVNGIDTDYYSADNCLCSIERDFIQEKFVFGHVARLHTIKNQIFLLEAFKSACQKNADFALNSVLIIVGDGPDRDKLENFVAKHSGLIGRVLFTGAKSNVRDYYRCFDVFTMSSIAEGIPMTLLESMSMGVPHLVTRVGGIKEVISDGETGLSVESGDLSGYAQAMFKLYCSADIRDDMSVKARERIEKNFSQEIMISSYQDLYQGGFFK